MSANESASGLSTCLTDRETEVLRLLVAGHTVKTIAARLGRSETSINERLRSARRKTGVGSSKVGNFSAAGNFGGNALRNGLNLRVTRNASGEFTLYYSTGFTYAAEPTNNGGTLTNAAYDTSSYFGIYGRFGNNGTTRRIYFDNFATGSGGSGGYVPGYEDREVTGATSTSVTGLVEDTTYYFRIRSEAGSCESDNSPTGSVTTGSSTVEPPDEFSAAAAGMLSRPDR